MEKTVEMQGRVLARIVASDLSDVVGGLPENYDSGTCQVTGEPQGNINGSDITNDCATDGD